MMPINPYLLLHRLLVWEQGLRAPGAASASVGWFPRPCQTSLLKTYCVSSAITGSRALAPSRISREQQEVAMQVYIGIDWSENKHDVCFMHETGAVLLMLQIQHTMAGFRELDQAGQ